MVAVILDTDIGTDIDDTWALAMLLGCPELDLRLVVTATGDTTYRARIAAGILAAGGRGDIPVAIGIPGGGAPGAPQEQFANQVDLDKHSGGVPSDGVEAIVETIMASTEPVTVVSIGPATNIAAALASEPAIAGRARFVGMHGSVRVGYNGAEGPVAEYNVKVDMDALRAVLAAGWEVTLTPLDTCGSVVLSGDRYSRLRQAEGPLIAAVLDNYRQWLGTDAQGLYERTTTTLFDTVAVYLAYAEDLVVIERLPIAIDDEGAMSIALGSQEIRVATSWRNQERFYDHLVERLMG